MMNAPESQVAALPAGALPFPRLIAGVFRERRNRFVALVDVPGGIVVSAHVPTTGRMRELLFPGAPVRLAVAERPGRVTPYDLVLAERPAGVPESHHGGGAVSGGPLDAGQLWPLPPSLVCIDSRVPNRLLAGYWRLHAGPCGAQVVSVAPEPRHDGGRFDFLLEDEDGVLHVEVKSVTLVRGGLALFPDAPTERGARHVRLLAAKARAGERAAIVFAIQRDDAVAMSPNVATDPAFGGALADAEAAGVKIIAYCCRVSPEWISVAGEVPVILG